MADLSEEIIVSIGSRPTDAVHLSAAISDGRPYIAWTLPSGFRQEKFIVEVTHESGEFFARSGTRNTSDQHFYWPQGVAMSRNFSGLCKVVVQVASREEGDFDFVSRPTYFVYDPYLNIIPNDEESVKISWFSDIDVDSIPIDGQRSYELQLSSDPFFTVLEYRNSNIFLGGSFSNSIELTGYEPQVNRNVFFRVRQFDGIDFGQWSDIKVFRVIDTSAPVVKINSFDSQGNLSIFTESERGFVSLNVFQTDRDLSSNTPIQFSGSLAQVRTGSVTVRIIDVEPGSFIAVSVSDANGTGNTDTIGPVAFESEEIVTESFSLPARYSVIVNGEITTLQEQDDINQVYPVNGSASTFGDDYDVKHPVLGSNGIYTKYYFEGKLERIKFGQPLPDADTDGVFDKIVLQFPHDFVLPPNTLAGNLGNGLHPTADLSNPHAGIDNFLFADPTAYEEHSDGWARPLGWSPDPDNSYPSSRVFGRSRYLAGYVNEFGETIRFNNFFDFNLFTDHKGREIWETGDAWLQVGVVKYTNRRTASVNGNDNKGLSWTPSLTYPYHRVPIESPESKDGFGPDYLIMSKTNDDTGETRTWIESKAYVDVVWCKASWLFGRESSSPFLDPFNVEGGIDKPARAYISGKQLSDIDGVWEYICRLQEVNGQRVVVCDWEIQHYILETRTGERLRFEVGSAESEDKHLYSFRGNGSIDFLDKSVLVRDQISYNTEGLVTTFRVQEDDYPPEIYPILSSLADRDDFGPQATPVHGRIFQDRVPFLSGYENDLPGHVLRPQAGQRGGFRVQGRTESEFFTQNLQFSFIPQVWDIFNTIHWQATAGLKFEVQYSQYDLEGNAIGWRGVNFNNAEYSPRVQKMLVSEFLNHGLWNTGDRQRFENGGAFRVRIRQVSDTGTLATEGEWVYSRIFSLVTGATNPISILSFEYEPWAKHVRMQIRVDGNGGHTSLTRFFYSTDSGVTFNEIRQGDIVGDVSFLSTKIGENVHEIIWDTSSYPISAGDDFRISIQSLPTGESEQIQLPFFRWLTPINPYIDSSEFRIAELMGRVLSRYFDQDLGEFVDVDPPIFEAGLVTNLRREYDALRDDDFWGFHTPDSNGNVFRPYVVGTGGFVPEGWHPNTPGPYVAGQTIQTRWSVSNQTGLNVWFEREHRDGGTNGNRLSRIANQIDRFVNFELPRHQRVVEVHERNIRKGLIDQGYYAERQFTLSEEEEIEESVEVRTSFAYAIGGTDPEFSEDGRLIKRPWRFRVQSYPEVPITRDGATGTFEDQTPLESVRYILQLDRSENFNSQSGKPLREFTQNYNGETLSVVEFTQTSEDLPVIVGGTMKIQNTDLPGEKESDDIGEFENWAGDYQIRVAAYNPVVGPILSVPRPEITETRTVGSATVIEFNPSAQEKLVAGRVSSIEYSTGSKPTEWTEPQQIDFVSDRRANNAELGGTPNVGREWIPRGQDRPGVKIFFDNDLMQYVLFYSKISFDGRWRIMQARSMNLPEACEYELIFEDSTIGAIYSPSVVKMQGGYAMLCTTQSQGSNPNISYSLSSDLRNWSDPIVATEGNSQIIGAQPSLIYKDDSFYAVMETPSGISLKKSTDLVDWESVSIVGFGERPCLTENFEVFYENPDGVIVFVTSEDNGITWSAQSDSLLPAGDSYCHIYSDIFRGNFERFAVTTKNINGNNVPHVQMLEDSNWETIQERNIQSQVDHPLGNDIETQRTIVNTVGLSVLDSRFRINLTNSGDEEAEFRRMSEWVGSENKDELDSHLEPEPWNYRTYIANFPYLR